MDDFQDLLMCYLRLTQHMSQQFRDYYGKLNLTFPQALVLTALGEGTPVPISALAEQTGSANSTVSGIVDRLEKLELVRRERGEHDRRVIYVSATEKYKVLRQRAETNVSDYFGTLLKDLPAEERAEIFAALSKLDRCLSKHAPVGRDSTDES